MKEIKPVRLYRFWHESGEEFERLCTDEEALHYVIHGDYKAETIKNGESFT